MVGGCMCMAQVVVFFLLIFGFPQPRDFSEAPELPDDVQVRLSVVEMRRHARCHAAQRETAIMMALLSHLSRRPPPPPPPWSRSWSRSW